MRSLAILTGAAVLLDTDYATAATMTSGRPSAVLDREQCRQVWHMAVPEGRYLDRQNAGPYIVNFALADRPGPGRKNFEARVQESLPQGLGEISLALA